MTDLGAVRPFTTSARPGHHGLAERIPSAVTVPISRRSVWPVSEVRARNQPISCLSGRFLPPAVRTPTASWNGYFVPSSPTPRPYRHISGSRGPKGRSDCPTIRTKPAAHPTGSTPRLRLTKITSEHWRVQCLRRASKHYPLA